MNWLSEVFGQLSPMFQIMAIFVALLHCCIAYWLYLDCQRFGRRATPAVWAVGGMVWGFWALGAYWWSTGSPRALMAFMVTMVTALILTTMYSADFADGWDRQMWYMLRETNPPGIGTAS